MNVSASVVIDASPGEVFQYVIDVSNEPKWRLKSTESALIAEAPMRLGSEGYSMADNNGKQIKVGWKVTTYEENRHATWDLISGPLVGTGGYLVEIVEGGTKFTLEAHVRMPGVIGFLMGPIVKLIGDKMNKADVANLKMVIENR